MRIIDPQNRLGLYKEQLDAVLCFNVSICDTNICFKSLEKKIALDLSIDDKKRVSELSDEQIERLKTKVNELKALLSDLLSKNASESERSALINEIDELEHTIREKKTVVTLLGEYESKSSTIYLFYKNIEATGNFREALFSTFIHELFHAWNYYASNCMNRTVLEIDEPMVEFGMLYFLYMLSYSNPMFEKTLQWGKEAVRKKQNSIGETTAYGFGYYLFSLIKTDQRDKALQILELYCKKSASMPSTPEVQKIKNWLAPLYLFDKEQELFRLFESIINTNYHIARQVFDGNGKTNIKLKDGNMVYPGKEGLVFPDYVDSVTLLFHNTHFYKVMNDGRASIWLCNGGYWFKVNDYVADMVPYNYHGSKVIRLSYENGYTMLMYVNNVINAFGRMPKNVEDIDVIWRLGSVNKWSLKGDDANLWAWNREIIRSLSYTIEKVQNNIIRIAIPDKLMGSPDVFLYYKDHGKDYLVFPRNTQRNHGPLCINNCSISIITEGDKKYIHADGSLFIKTYTLDGKLHSSLFKLQNAPETAYVKAMARSWGIL